MSKTVRTRRSIDRTGRQRATSYDVAELAGVSQSAVSRVFQGGPGVSKTMRVRVMAAAAKLRYRPNAIARGLITQRSNLVAVIVSKLLHLNYPEVLVELTQQFSELEIRVLLFALEHITDTGQVLDQVIQFRVDGIVTAATLTPEQIKTIDNAHIPVVFYNRAPMDLPISSVRCDQEQGERWLVDELVKAGHKSFGIVAGPTDGVNATVRKMAALNKLSEMGITDITTVSGEYGYDTGLECFAELVTRRGDPPDAVIASNDITAIGCIDAARKEFGLEVPQDISIVGFDGVGPARFAAYDVATIRQPLERMTQSAVSMLIERIENPEMPPERRVFSGIPIRGGSARLQTDDP